MRVTNYNPTILTWAAARADKDMSQLQTYFPKIEQWLDKSYAPTLKQLEDFAKKVYLPFGYLFLPEPPREELPITFFRTGLSEENDLPLTLIHTVQTLKERQEWLRQFLIDNETAPLPFVGSFSSFRESSIESVVVDMRKVLKLQQDWFREFKTLDEIIIHLINQMEKVGVMVSMAGTVNGNTHRPISRDDFRGFALVDDYAPFVFVNSNDSKSAQIFTLIHELAHIWIGKSAGTDMFQLLPANDSVEVFCNRVAAEFLVPTQLFMEQWNHTHNFSILRKYFKVSEMVVARKAYDLGVITKEDYVIHYQVAMAAFIKFKESQGSGGSYYYTARRRVGAQFARYIDSAVKQDRLLYRDAYSILNVKGDAYKRLTIEFL
jgi:Zn-dependent peptidase ImmA (M78 family)